MDRFSLPSPDRLPKPPLLTFIMGPGLMMFMVILVFGSFTLLYNMVNHERRTQAWHDALREMQVKGALFHFNFEARLRNEAPAGMSDPWDTFEEARAATTALLQGRPDADPNPALPLDELVLIEATEELSADLATIETIGRAIERSAGTVGFTEAQDSALDASIHEFMRRSVRLEMLIAGRLVSSHTNIQTAFIVILTGWISVLGVALLGLRSYERSRRRGEKALLRAKRDWERTFDSVPDLITILDKDHGILRLNRAMAERLGVKESEAIGRKCYEVVHGTACAITNCPHAALLKDGQIHSEEVHEKNLGGHFLVTASPLTDTDGRLDGSVHVAHDITARKQLEDAQAFIIQCGYQSSGEDFFMSLAEYLARSLGVDYVCIDSLHGDGLTAQTLAVYHDGKFEDNVAYALEDTPCGEAVGKTICCFAQDVRRLFPNDAVLQDMRAESYAGTTLWSFDGKPIGLIAVIGKKPMPNLPLAESVLKMVAVRAAGELERKQREDAMEQAKKEWEMTFDSVPDLIAIVDSAHVIRRVNRAMARRLGVREADAVGRRCHELVHGAACAIVDYPHTALMGEGAIHTTEVYEERLGGHFLVTASPITDKDGNPAGSVQVAHDITARKRAEQALTERLKELECLYRIANVFDKGDIALESIFAHAVEAVPPAWQYPEITACRIVFRDGSFQTENFRETEWKLSADIRLHGAGVGLIEVCYLERKPGSDEGPFRQEEVRLVQAVARMLENMAHQKEAEEALRKSYEVMEEQVLRRTTDLKETNLQLERKILELNRTQESLRSSETRYRILSNEFNALLDAIEDTLLLVAPSLKVVWANRGATRQLGKPMSELAGRHCHELIFGTVEPCERCPVKDCFETGAPQTSQVRTSAGRILDLRAYPIQGDSPRPANVILSATDVTLETAMRTEALRTAQLASLGQLAAGVAHEINNPINGIINYAQIVANDSAPDTEVHDLAQKIMKEGDRVATIVGSLLSFARDRKEERRPTPVSEILSDTLGLMGSQFRKNGIRLVVDIPVDLPPLQVSPQKIQQVFLNLLGNGQDALNERFPGADEGKIFEIHAERLALDGKIYVRTVFRDHGTGIRPEDTERIFQPFVTTKPPGSGTGLGLSISQEIVHAHAGRLSIDSRHGEFTEVRVDLPISETQVS